MISIEDDIFYSFDFEVKLQFNDSVHTFIFLFLRSFILIEDLGINFSGSCNKSKVKNLIRINAEVLLHTFNNIFINDKKRFMKKIVFRKSLLHFNKTFHDLFTLWIEKSRVLSNSIEEMAHCFNSFGSDHYFLLSVCTNDGNNLLKSWHESRIKSIEGVVLSNCGNCIKNCFQHNVTHS